MLFRSPFAPYFLYLQISQIKCILLLVITLILTINILHQPQYLPMSTQTHFHPKAQLSTNAKSNQLYPSPNRNDYSSAKNKAGTYGNPAKKLNFIEENESYLQDARNIMRESQRRIASSISMADLFKENIDNKDFKGSSYTKVLNSASRSEELELLHNQHRIEVQKLLLEISRLHDVIYEVERTKKYELQRLKQQCEQMTYLHLSNLKQAQSNQIQIMDIQLKKAKDALNEKSEQIQISEKAATKERQMHKNEIQTLKSCIKQLVNKKNAELFQAQQQNQEKMRLINTSNASAIEEMKETCQREMKKLHRELKQKQQKVVKLEQHNNQASEKTERLEETIEKQRVQLEERLQLYILESSDRYHSLMKHLGTVLEQQENSHEGKQNLLKDAYSSEIENLLRIIGTKGNQNARIKTQLETERLQFKLLLQNAEKENAYLHKLLKNAEQRNLQEVELLKVKMAILHENDLKQLVCLYDSKIDSLTQELARENSETVRLRDYMHSQTQRWYENKKKYQSSISKLNVEILRLKSGLGGLQKDMKQRLENERSAMMLTSQSLIKGAELKNTNAKFYEQQLRKLRATMEKCQQGADENQKHLRSEITSLQDQLQRTIEAIKVNDAENQKMEEVYRGVIQEKENEIKRLNKVAKQLIEQKTTDQSQEMNELLKHVEYLNKQIQEKSERIKQLHSRIEKLERDLQDFKVENEQLYLENQINHEHVKGEYEKIANSNLKSLKQFYERRIQQLESDKAELRSKQSADQANIAELVRRYQALQDCMKTMAKQARKRTWLEEKISSLGMDNNLVKNKAQLLGRGQEQVQ